MDDVDRAERDGNEWVINGTKQWTSNGPHVDYCYVFAVTNRELHAERRGGVSCFIVPMDAPGANVDSVIRIFGEVGGDEAILSFNDVRVPAANLVGDEGAGFRLAMGGVSLGASTTPAGRSVTRAGRWRSRRSTRSPG